MSWSWREGFRFALARKFVLENGVIYSLTLPERIGTRLLGPFYSAIGFISKHIRRPIAILLFTIGAALIALIVFYNIPALLFVGKIFPSKTVRFLLFFYTEVNLLALVMTAFGRFSNPALISLWKEGRLFPKFPGDS